MIKNSLYSSCHDWMTQRNIGFVNMMLPFYVSASCCHALNLENKRREFYFEHGQPADLRLHVFLAAPPGYMKTFILKRFLDRRNSIFGNTAIKTAFMGQATEAGFVGTINMIDGEPVQVPGMAYDFQDHILGIDEFSALTNTMLAEHSKNLDNALLTALDSGYLIKRLAAGEIRYETHLTLFGGSQPARFNLSSGLGRRFLFIFFVPNSKQQRDMRMFRRAGKGTVGDPELDKAVFNLTTKLVKDMEIIKGIEYDKSIYKGLDELDIPHYEEPLFEKVALGYNLATKKIEKDFVVELTPTIKEMWRLEKEWRHKIKSGAQDAQVIQFIEETPGISESDLKEKMLDFGMTFSDTAIAIESLRKQHRIGIISDRRDKKMRKRYLWPQH